MILTDAGPLVALLDRGEQMHEACVHSLSLLTGPLLTTWPAFTEAMSLLGEAGGWRGQAALWQIVDRGDLRLAAQDEGQTQRMAVLMKKYQDRPMDLAAASLVALAESLGLCEIFTLDRTDFQVYRIAGRRSFRIWPRDPSA